MAHEALPPTDRVECAARMVSVQTGCSIHDAVLLLRETAAATDCTMEELAELVISREVSF